MLAWRLVISAILIPLLIGVFALDARSGHQALWLLLLVQLLVIRGVWEVVELLRGRFPQIQWIPVAICALAVVFSGWIPHLFYQQAPMMGVDLTPMALAVAGSALTLMTLQSFRFQKPGHAIETVSVELFIVVYVGFLLALTTQLRWVAGPAAGYLVLGSVLVCAKGGDIAAYFAGRSLGKSKFAPILSPKKTWAGFWGAVAGGAICGWLWLQFLTPVFLPGTVPCSAIYSMIYGGLLAVAGAIGDLCESLLKRDVERKDSAALFPGFGGMLDMLDSVLFAGPVALLLWMILPLATWTR